ncbi:hypothetical protein [Botrimarina hoheduenensis]|uniref:Uncharacterized protein n=1 Tax=Botrimarina hoheduenensis TaxID=2528000 RepID=A0A5C5VW85_9BACT|nr:hypothetical protein [Botrimarina hoheduenensis]TWT42878.1 hypothetical protein Pla111_25160 [Botrimarina hoheduenensis]
MAAAAVTGMLLLATSAVIAAAAATEENPAIGNLGEGLLGEGLEGLFPRAVEAAPSAQTRPAPLSPDEDALRKQMEEAAQRARQGEDVAPTGNPLAGIAERMQEAAALLDDGQTATPALPVQRQAVADLDRLIAQAEQQSQSSSSSSQSKDSQRQKGQRSESQPAGSQPAGGTPSAASASQQSAQRATGQPTNNQAEAVEASALGSDAMKAAWGHLPERVREQLLQSSADEYLPQYREELEAYFRRLAEEDAARP